MEIVILVQIHYQWPLMKYIFSEMSALNVTIGTTCIMNVWTILINTVAFLLWITLECLFSIVNYYEEINVAATLIAAIIQ